MPDALNLAGIVLAFLVPRLVERYVSAVPSRWWPFLSAFCALLGIVATVTWTPVLTLLLTMPKSPVGVILAVLAALVVYWAYVAAHEREVARTALPVEVNVTQIQGAPWNPPGQRILLGRVLLTNRSPTNRVNLRFRLHVSLLKPDGTSVPHVIDEHVGRPASPPTDLGTPLLGPLDIAPETTVEGSLSFYVMAVSNMLDSLLALGKVSYSSKVGGNVLTVTDLVSGKSRDYRVPTSMGGTVNRLR